MEGRIVLSSCPVLEPSYDYRPFAIERLFHHHRVTPWYLGARCGIPRCRAASSVCAAVPYCGIIPSDKKIRFFFLSLLSPWYFPELQSIVVVGTVSVHVVVQTVP